MPKGYTISAVVLAHNSEKKIAKCLESLKGWADEIIIVDGESTDSTARIAESFGAKVYSHKFLGAFSAERNFGSDKAKSEWVLQLDSDEIVSAEFKKKCDEVLPDTKYAAFKFRRKNVFLGHEFRYGGWYHWSQHMFKKGRAHYEGRVHEKMIVDPSTGSGSIPSIGRGMDGEVGELDADILHVPFDSISEFIDRQNRYTELQAKDIIDQEKELTRKMIVYNLKVKPAKLFRKMYFKNKGYKEGVYGLVFSILFSWVHFLKWAKVWELVKDKKNILVIRNDRFGEFLLNIPAIKALKQRFPASRIVLAVDPYVEPLAKAVPYVDEVVPWKSGKHGIFDTIAFSRKLKRYGFDMAFVMNPSKDSNLALFMAKIPERFGYARKWDFLLTKTIKDRKAGEEKHEVEYNLDLVALVGAATDDKSISLNIPKTGFANPGMERISIPGLSDGKKPIAIHPWTSDEVKQWPVERFRELALRIAKELGREVVIVGAGTGLGKSEQFNYLHDKISNMTGKTTLPELAQVLKESALLISCDSGPVHLAACVQTPVIALFRNDIKGKGPKRWGPWGKGNVVIEKARLSDITVDEVIRQIKTACAEIASSSCLRQDSSQ
jgi:ADP-heptose:LPS heptosyltransferase